MSKWAKLVDKIVRGSQDANISFDDLCALLERLGFEKRSRGSHTIFRRQDVVERVNLQREGKNAKPYQVKQVRQILLKHRLGDEL